MAKKRNRSTTGKRSRSTSNLQRARRLSTFSTADLHAEIQRREREIITRREELSAELQQIESEIKQLAGFTDHQDGAPRSTRRGRPRRPTPSRPAAATTRRGGRKRPRNEMNLVEALHDLLKDQTMSVTEMADAVQEAGYRTSSPNFRTIVNQALINNPDRFRRVSRGKYTAR